MPVPESPGSPQSHRSMSLPSGHQGHGHYSPMSSPQVSIYFYHFYQNAATINSLIILPLFGCACKQK